MSKRRRVPDDQSIPSGETRWAIHDPPQVPQVLRALPLLLGAPATLQVVPAERQDPDVTALLRHWEQGAGLVPERGCYHIPATPQVLSELAVLLKTRPNQTPAHITLYDQVGVLLVWHDARDQWPIFASNRIAPEQMAGFCETLKCPYKLLPPGA